MLKRLRLRAGWDSLGCVAGEVKDGGRTYPIAIGIAMFLITINYAFPGTVIFIAIDKAGSLEFLPLCMNGLVGAGIMVNSDFSTWEEGSLETIAMTIAPWLGVWVGAAAVIATLGEFNVVMACSSRALWAVADYKMLPSILTTEWERFGTPIAAVIFQTVTTGILMNFSFEFLVVLDTFFNKYVNCVVCFNWNNILTIHSLYLQSDSAARVLRLPSPALH